MQWRLHQFQHPFMAGIQQGYPLLQILLCQALGCTVKGFLLDIKGPDMPCFSNEMGQEQGVLAIATGGISDPVAGLDEATQEQMAEWDRSTQGRVWGQMI